MGEGSDRHELEERRAALRRLMPVTERLRGLDGVTWAGGRRDRNGAYLVRYPTYDEDTLAVMEAFGGGVLTRHGYLDELERRGLSDGSLTDLTGLAEQSDEDLTRALLTWVVRSERFVDGAIAESLTEGSLVALLDRLQELYEL